MSATAAVVARQASPLDMGGIPADLSGYYAHHRSPEIPVASHLVAADANAAQRGTTGGLAPWQVRKVRQHIEARIGHGIPLDELAREVRLSTSYFSTAFKATFGIPPHNYVVSCRVEHAKQRMLTSDAPLCEIALDCGLADQSHLSRVFRRVTGTTPSAWRRYFSRRNGELSLQ